MRQRDVAAHQPRQGRQGLRNGVAEPGDAVVEVVETLIIEQTLEVR